MFQECRPHIEFPSDENEYFTVWFFAFGVDPSLVLGGSVGLTRNLGWYFAVVKIFCPNQRQVLSAVKSFNFIHGL